MAPSTASKLILLQDQTQITIEERNRLILLNLNPSPADDAEINKSLSTILQGIKTLEREQASSNDTNDANVLKRLVANYNKLLDNFQQDKHINVNHLRYSLSTIDVQEEQPETVAVQRKLSKSVRFKEDLEEHEPNSGEPERERERFMQPYKDDPEPLDERSNLTSNGLFVEQEQMMRDQDQHLDRLALSVSRQHELSIQIDDELSSHIELLGDVEALTDRSQSRLEMAKKRLEKFSKQAKENGSMLTIGILILIFIILIVVLK